MCNNFLLEVTACRNAALRHAGMASLLIMHLVNFDMAISIIDFHFLPEASQAICQ